ncbi:MAG: trehalase family glycosidase [Bacteroidota bacterium]
MDDLVSRAKHILKSNWRNGFTIPTEKLYPFQWNWDSGFTAIGFANYDLESAIQELASLFSGQWVNGMVPHIIFHSESEKSYFPNFDFWNAAVNSGAPSKPKTSGITQPPVHGFVLENLLIKHRENDQLNSFVKYLYPKIVKSHRWFYTCRDPEREGLTYIFHPWESGRDNSPLWDKSLDRIDLEESDLPDYVRRDTSIAPHDERPTREQYDRYVYLLELGKKYRYEDNAIYKESPFLIQDTLMNAMLIKSNDSLIKIGRKFGFDVGEIEEWQQQSKPKFSEKLWNEELSTFVVFDQRGNQQIKEKEIGGLSALYANIPNAQRAQKLNDYLKNLHNRGFYICPSFDVDSPLFDSKRYWRGPIWPQMNWMLYNGLRNYNFTDTANIIRADFIHLVRALGFYEYFESEKTKVENLSSGYGGERFSWTASCALDLLLNDEN